MQQFIDNWSATLLASATAADVTISVEPARAALLVGLGGGNVYQLTLVDRNAEGVEIAWDIVTVTGRTGGVLDVIRAPTARAWAAGTVIEARLTAAALAALRDAGGTAVGSDAPQSLGESSSPGTSAQASRQDHVHAMPTPAEVGAASVAQAEALAAALADKVDAEPGKALSSNDYTTAEKNKLAGLEAGHFKGLHASLAALQAAHPTAAAGNYADVDAGAGLDVVRYLWDVSDSAWVAQAAAGGSMTAAQVKAAYESNPDTNPFTDADKTKLDGLSSGGGPSKATFLNWMFNTAPLGMVELSRYYPGVGSALRLVHGIGGVSTILMAAGVSQATSGAGALVSASGYGFILGSGTTAAGQSRVSYAAPTVFRSPSLFNISANDKCLAASFIAYANGSLSDATDRYTFSISLGGNLQDDLYANTGIRLDYTDSVNGGNWVIKYPNADGVTISSLNTTVPCQTSASDLAKITIVAARTGANSSTVTVTFGVASPVTYTISDSRLHNTGTAIMERFGAKLVKSLGTASRLCLVVDPILYVRA